MISLRATLALAALLVAVALSTSEASAGGDPSGSCTDVTTIDRKFSLGSRFRVGVRMCPREGLVLHTVRYTPRGGVERLVLSQGNVAQIHVPYHMGSPRWRDLSEDTEGLGVNATPLTAQECSGGARYSGNRVCSQIEERGYAWKHGHAFALGEELKIWTVSQLDAYDYINEWSFRDDGGIEIRMGLTGVLQEIRHGSEFLPYGARLNPESAHTPLVGINHVHAVYYRLDFDINGSGSDAVDRISLKPSFEASPEAPCSTPGECVTDVLTRLTSEAVDFFVPEEHTMWRVFDKATKNADGRNIGYQLAPKVTGLWAGMSSSTEPWSSGELWVTRFNKCEQLAFDNEPPFIQAGCAGAATDVTDMVSDEHNINGADVVLWYANRFRHFVRDEDTPNMPIEWISFELLPMSFFHQDPVQ